MYHFPIWHLLRKRKINKSEADLLEAGFIPATMDAGDTYPLTMSGFKIGDIVIGQ